MVTQIHNVMSKRQAAVKTCMFQDSNQDSHFSAFQHNQVYEYTLEGYSFMSTVSYFSWVLFVVYVCRLIMQCVPQVFVLYVLV